MFERFVRRTALFAATAILAGAAAAAAQSSTGSVSGTIRDAQGGVLPGATIVVVSETRGTKAAPVVSGSSGTFVVPNLSPDTYSVDVTMSGFKTLSRKKVAVSGGDRLSLGDFTLELGGVTEVIDVTDDAPVIQAQSGERSFAVTPQDVQNLPISNRSFTSLAAFAPGVTGTTRTGGGGSTQMTMDGVSTMDTGSNRIMLEMNVEAIAEVKVMTSGYQAEFGRASGLQLVAVTRSGTNRFHGSTYYVKRDSDWNSKSWTQIINNQPKTLSKEADWGYSIGGPLGKPGGSNKLFFFYSHEYRPRTGGGQDRNFRIPTLAEINGDYSATTDQNGALMPWIKDPLLAASTCVPTATGDHSGCFAADGVMGRIPASRLAGLPAYGRQILQNMYNGSLANGGPGSGTPTVTGANMQFLAPTTHTRRQQPLIRVDYQPTTNLRLNFRYAGEYDIKQVSPGSMPGWNDTFAPHPGDSVKTFSSTVNYTLNSTTFLEGTWGYVSNYIANLPTSEFLARDTSGVNVPLIYPDAFVVDPRYHAYELLTANPIPGFSNGRVTLLPTMNFGGRVANALPTPNLGLLNTNETYDIALSVTKIVGRHTFKSGFYQNHSFKAQNAGNPGNTNSQGTISFNSNEANNPFDTNFPFSNALFGVFDTYSQLNRYVEGSYLSNNIEGFIQDNWKVNNRLTLDYGLRLVHQQPQYDQFLNASNFLPDQWALASAPALYRPGCAGTAVTCGANARVAVLPDGSKLGAGSNILIGNIVPNTGDRLNGIRQAGDGISKYTYNWPALAYAPRVGAAYDLRGDQRLVVRGGGGLFYDRPSGNSLFGGSGIGSNPPMVEATTYRYGFLEDMANPRFTVLGVPALSVFEEDSKLPSSVQWNMGTQAALPWATSVDVSYVGQHSYNGLQGVNINTIDLGTAFNPAYNDPTVAVTATTIPGANSLVTTFPTLVRTYQGYGAIQQQWARSSNTYHSLQISFTRRFSRGFSFGFNDTIGISDRQNVIAPRLEHAPDGTLRERSDQAAATELLGDNGVRRHILKGNFVWDMPDYRPDGNTFTQVLGHVVSDWQLSGVFTGDSGTPYSAAFAYQGGINTNTNLTGSPDYSARVVLNGDVGDGCSNNEYKQFNTDAFLGAQINSVGLESGNNYLTGCADRRFDFALARNINMGGGKSVQLRVEAFNAFNTIIYSGRNTTKQITSPSNQTEVNPQYLADGTVDPTKIPTGSRAFGAANAAMTLRTIQAQVRFQF